MLTIPESVIKNTQAHLSSFLWKSKKDRVKRPTSFPGSLFFASFGRWKRDPGCGWSRDHPESGWLKYLLEGWGKRVFDCHSDKFTKAGRERYVA